MKNLEEKKLLVKMARMLGEEIDPALLESIEREEKLAAVFFGAPAPAEKPAPIPILKEDLPQPEQPIVEEPQKPAETDLVPTKKDLIQQTVNSISASAPAKSPYRDKEIDGIRKQLAEMMQKIATMSWGGGGSGEVNLRKLDDVASSTIADGLYLKYDAASNKFVFDSGGGGGGGTGPTGPQGPSGPSGPAGSTGEWILKTANYTANSGDRIIADTSAGSFNITLPASPSTGNSVTIIDGNDWSTNPITINRNGSTIEGISDDMYSDNKGVVIALVYNGNSGVNTWQVASTLGPAGPSGPAGFGNVNTTVITSSTYTVSANDYYIGVNYAGNVTITNPVSTNGRMIVIKDESGNCSNNPIIVAGTIDNDAGGFNLQIDNGSVNMVYRSGWRIV